MKAIETYCLIKPTDLHWRPSNLMRIPNADYLERTQSEILGARLWRFPAKSAGTLHKHPRAEEFYFVLEGEGRFVVGEETRTAGEGHAVWAPAGVPHGVRNDTNGRLVLLVGIAPFSG